MNDSKCKYCEKRGLIGRHCLECGKDQPLARDEAKRLGKLKDHCKPEPESGEAVVSVMERYGITLPANAIEWRVDGRTGQHPLYRQDVTVLLTDGVVAWYALGMVDPIAKQLPAVGETSTQLSLPLNSIPLLFGHLSNFTENEAEKPFIPRKSNTPKVKLARLAQLADED